MKTFSPDLRERIFWAVQQGTETVEEVAATFGVSVGFVYKLIRQNRSLGHCNPLPHGGGKRPLIPEDSHVLLLSWIEVQPDTTLDELSFRLEEERGVKVSRPTMWRFMKKMGFNHKKKSKVAAEADPLKRASFAEEIKALAGEKLIFVDETGINTDMTRIYGWAPKPERLVEAVPVNTPPPTSVVGALGANGMVCSMCVEGAIDGESFALFIEQMLVPNLKPGQVVLMDNLSAHKTERAEVAIEAAGAELIYLPAYSPDFNPIEECWSKIKSTLRALRARTKEELMKALKLAIDLITPGDVQGWFAHSGYSFTHG